MLHITNGDSAAGSLRRSGIGGEVLAWRDILHEGPVPAGLPLADLSAVRARFLADAGLADRYDAVLADFQARDAALARFAGHDEVALWFEHDLYDQLQLLQLLDWFNGQSPGATRLSLICIGSFAGHPNFHGLGELTPAELASLFPARHTVTPAELALGRAAWEAFRSPDPTEIERLLSRDTTALPFLRAALLRHLEEFPAAVNGLSRTERQLIEAIAGGNEIPRAIFGAWQAREQAPFMGDSSLWWHLWVLGQGPQPLVELAGGGRFLLPHESASPDQFAAQRLALTAVGWTALAGQEDQLTLNDIDRWLGGVRLTTPGPVWRWDGQSRRLVLAAA
jgi:hypothetical protein